MNNKIQQAVNTFYYASIFINKLSWI